MAITSKMTYFLGFSTGVDDKLLLSLWFEVKLVDKRKRILHREWHTMAQSMATAQIQPLPILEKKVLLKHSHIHSFRCCLWLLSMAELSCCNKNSMTCKAQNIYYLSLARKSVITPGLRLSGER